jgi:hypothetical protein
MTFHRWFLPCFGSFSHAFQGRRFSEIDQPETKLWQPCLLTDWNEMSYLNRGISIDASYQVLVHLAK